MKKHGYAKVAPGATREKREHEICRKKVETSFLKGRISNIEPDLLDNDEESGILDNHEIVFNSFKHFFFHFEICR